MSTPNPAPPAGLSGMSATLALLEGLPDEVVQGWGKCFEWRAPALDVGWFADPRIASRALAVLGLKSAAVILVEEGSARLKTLLLRPDMFGPEVTGPEWVGRQGLRLDERSIPGCGGMIEQWMGVLAAAWSMADERSIDRITPWVPSDAKERALHQRASDDLGHPLWAWAAQGIPENPASHARLLARAREWVVVACGPSARVGHTGRKPVRDEKVWTEWLLALSAVAASRGNQAWLTHTRALRPDCVEHSGVVAAALGGRRFGLADWLIGLGVQEEPAPAQVKWSSVPWLQSVYHGSHDEASWAQRGISGLKPAPDPGSPQERVDEWNLASAWFIRSGGAPEAREVRALEWSKAFCTTPAAPCWGAAVVEALAEIDVPPEISELATLMRSGSDEAWQGRRAAWDLTYSGALTRQKLTGLFFPQGQAHQPYWSVDRFLRRAADWSQARPQEDTDQWVAELQQMANDANVRATRPREGDSGFAVQVAQVFMEQSLPAARKAVRLRL